MIFSITLEPIPLSVNADGVVQVGGTRVTLDTVVGDCDRGATEFKNLFGVPIFAAGGCVWGTGGAVYGDSVHFERICRPSYGTGCLR